MVVSTETLKEIIINLQSTLDIKFSNKQREIIEFIAKDNYSGRGITVKHLETQFSYTKHYAEKVITELKSRKIIIPTSVRKGHMKTYFLTNMQDYIRIPEYDGKANSSYQMKNYDIHQDLIMTLLKAITNNPGGFHDIRLQTRLNYNGDYDRLALDGQSRWSLKCDRNKAKVKEVRLSPFRTARLQVSPNGTVEIYIGASRNPYTLYKEIGLSELMADLGKIESIFHADLNTSNPLEYFLDWWIIRLDYNYDVKNLKASYISESRGKLQVKDLSGLYQFYVKQLPTEGAVLRLENRLSFPKPYPTIKEFMDRLSK